MCRGDGGQSMPGSCGFGRKWVVKGESAFYSGAGGV